MQIRKILLSALVCALSIFSKAQEPGSVHGTLKSQKGEALPALTVKLFNTSLVSISNNSGVFSIDKVKPGPYTLLVTGIGFKSERREVTIAAGQQTTVNVTLTEEGISMEGVTVLGRSVVQETNRQAFNITAVDAKAIYNSTLDLAGALDRVAGIRVRESGGVGSNFNLSLNGFSGNHVRYFIDGIPMDGMGSSFQINNIPINAAR